MANLWDRQEGESDKQFRAFEYYRSLGLDRGLVDVYRHLYGKPAASESPPWFRAWAKAFDWGLRARAWDAYALRQIQDAEIAEQKRRAEQRVAAWDTLLGASMTIIQKAKIKDLSAEDPSEARKLLPTALQGVRDALRGLRTEHGEPEQIVEQRMTGAGGRPLGADAPSGFDANALATDLARYLRDADDADRSALLDDYEAFIAAADRISARLYPNGEGSLL